MRVNGIRMSHQDRNNNRNYAKDSDNQTSYVHPIDIRTPRLGRKVEMCPIPAIKEAPHKKTYSTQQCPKRKQEEQGTSQRSVLTKGASDRGGNTGRHCAANKEQCRTGMTPPGDQGRLRAFKQFPKHTTTTPNPLLIAAYRHMDTLIRNASSS